MAETHSLMGGKLHVYKRENSNVWQCSTFLNGRNHRKSTKEDSLARAKEVAEDWYLEMRGKSRAGLLKPHEKTFNDAADRFVDEYQIITEGQRSPSYIETQRMKLTAHLRPYFGTKGLSEITAGLVQEYRLHRHKTSRTGKTLARSTIHHEIVLIRQILKTAIRHGWLHALPDLSIPYKTAGKIAHRAWFSPKEYRQLYLATRERAKSAASANGRWKWEREQFHDYVLFMGNTGLRPDEAARIEFRDVRIVRDQDSGETILEIEVRGKRGTGYCKSTTGAVVPFRRLRERLRTKPAQPETPEAKPTRIQAKPEPTDLIFPGGSPRELMNAVLDELGLKKDREGNVRTSYSLRHTYICIRLMEGADIYQIAKNCRTSVEMIEKFYAAHLKTTLDASAINVRKQRTAREGQSLEDIAARLAKLEGKQQPAGGRAAR